MLTPTNRRVGAVLRKLGNVATKKLPQSYPPFLVRRFNDFEAVYNTIRDLFRSVEVYRREVEDMAIDHADRLDALTGSGVPTSTPTDTNLSYLDTVAKDMYVSVGTASSADWKKTTP